MGEGIVREFGLDMDTLLHLTRRTNKDLLDSTGNAARWRGTPDCDPPTPSALTPDCAPPSPAPQAHEQSPSGHRGGTEEGVDGALPLEAHSLMRRRNLVLEALSPGEAGHTHWDKQPEEPLRSSALASGHGTRSGV